MTTADYMPYITTGLAVISGIVGFIKLSNEGAASRATTTSNIADLNVRMLAVELKQSKIEQMASDMAAMRTDISWIKGIISVGQPSNKVNNN